MERNQFTFYRSFWDSLKELPKKDQLPFLMAIGYYVFEEEIKPLTGAAAASFLLVKPILDKASKRASSGKQGGSKPKANGKQTQAKAKQTASDIEGEKEIEGEIEIEDEGDTPYTPHDPAVAAVMSAYLDKINPKMSERVRDELAGFVEVMGAECCLRAIDIALDNKIAKWPYIQRILETKQAQGVRCLADWDAVEAKRQKLLPTGEKSFAELAAEMDGEA